ncbi:MAG TPA: MDR family MFS transporter [Ktedonobacteraceae bacterium]|nr:MDR family MFS transporter [Ktedonobacteraceae bacterium]
MAQTQAGSTTTIIQEPQALSAIVSRQRLISILIGVLLGMLLAALDQTIVGTALPRIVSNLGGLDHYAWVVTAYLLASTVSVPIYGKLSDIYGRRFFFITGMVIFLAGSALAGTSQDMTQLIIYRGIQGLGAGAMMPIALAIIGDLFPPSERGKWQGLFVAVFGLASIIGPTLGGWITDNWGWRWVFYVNMPVGAIAILTAGFVLPKAVRRIQHTIDYLGAITLVAGAVPLLLAFSWAGTQYAWGSWQVILMFVIAAVMLAVFLLLELRNTEPIISPRLFKNSIFLISVVSTFLVSAGMFGAILYLPLFVQGALGNSATNSGYVLTPLMIGFMISSILGGQLLSRTGRYKVLALVGFAVAALGMFLLSRMEATTGEGEVVRNMIVTGLGIGVMMSLFTIVVQNAFPYRQLGEVTATLTFFRSIGSTIGVAVMGSIMTNNLQSSLQSNLPAALTRLGPASGLSQLNPQALLDPSQLGQLQHSFARFGAQGIILFHQFIEAVRVSLASAITQVFFLGFIIMLLGLVVCLFLREIPLRKSHNAQAAQQATTGPNRSRALLGLTLALMAREAQKPEADPQILATLSNAVNGRYPHTWSDEERGRAVAQDIIEPLSITLLASSVSNGRATGLAQTTEGTPPEASNTPSSSAILG